MNIYIIYYIHIYNIYIYIYKYILYRYANNCPLLDISDECMSCVIISALKSFPWHIYGFKLKIDMISNNTRSNSSSNNCILSSINWSLYYIWDDVISNIPIQMILFIDVISDSGNNNLLYNISTFIYIFGLYFYYKYIFYIKYII